MIMHVDQCQELGDYITILKKPCKWTGRVFCAKTEDNNLPFEYDASHLM
jgi:hypothetical protein